MTNVWVDETRPLLQGGRLTAWELGELGVPYQLIADSMAASLMAQGQVDAVWVGADRIAANGDVANKIGTYSLAVLAHYHQIPFYVAAPQTTLDRHCPNGAAIPIEQRAAAEVTGWRAASARYSGRRRGRRLQSGVRRHACWADKRLGAGQRGGHPGAGRRRGVCAGQRITDVVPGPEKGFPGPGQTPRRYGRTMATAGADDRSIR